MKKLSRALKKRMSIFFLNFKILFIGAALCISASPALAKEITFSGYKFVVKEGYLGPGPTNWSADNVWVDSLGRLHLRFSEKNGVWYGAEVHSLQEFGYGTYIFSVEYSDPNYFDKNIVFGLFQYPMFRGALDGTHEIDIEVSRFGVQENKPLSYAVYQVQTPLVPATQTFNFPTSSTHPTKHIHAFKRSMKQVEFTLINPSSKDTIFKWTFAPQDYKLKISQRTMPVFFNLWSKNTKPSNNQNVEVIISKFFFRPEMLLEPANVKLP